MKRDTSTSADDLSRPDGNSLLENYQKHDVGHRETVRRLEDKGYELVEWGIDKRHDSGEDGIIYDDKMDFKIFKNDELVALLDVKTKGSPRYMGRFNERHYAHYYGHSEDFEVPVFVVMYQVDYKSDSILDEFVFEIGRGAIGGRVKSSKDSAAVDTFPDGNEAVLVPHRWRTDWRHLERKLESSYVTKLFKNQGELIVNE